MEVVMFGFNSFSEAPISDDGFVRTDPYGGGLVVLHFNKDVLKFPFSKPYFQRHSMQPAILQSLTYIFSQTFGW